MNTETTNEARIEGLEVAFFEAVEAKDVESAEQVLGFLTDAKEWGKATELLPHLYKLKMMKRMKLPADYGEENVLFREQDNPLKDVKVEECVW